MEEPGFSHGQDELQNIAADAVARALRLGASAAQAHISEGFGLSVGVRKGETEEVEFGHDRSLDIVVFAGVRRGGASCGDFAPAAIADAVARAIAIAKNSAADPCFGLADAALLAKEFPELNLWHPRRVSAQEARDLALEAESAALDFDVRISADKSEGAQVHSAAEQFACANSHGFCAAGAQTDFSISCGAIAEKNGEMQADGWSSSMRDFADLEAPREVGEHAARRAVERLGAKPLATCKAPVLFRAPVSHSLIRCIIGAASGGRLYRKMSYLGMAAGKRVAASHLNIREEPLLAKGMRSAAYDDEGVAARSRDVLRDGELCGYFLDSYTARKLGLQTTANAGGAHNLIVAGRDEKPFADLVKELGRGLIVTELMGQGADLLTGDYSRGASGFWVEGGEIQFPVAEITVAADLREMLPNIAAVGADILTRGAITCGSVLVGEMTVGGNIKTTAKKGD
jgi:PmbA protein